MIAHPFYWIFVKLASTCNRERDILVHCDYWAQAFYFEVSVLLEPVLAGVRDVAFLTIFYKQTQSTFYFLCVSDYCCTND